MSTAIQPEYVAAENFPARGSSEDKLRFLLRYAALAPWWRESRPWTADIDGETVELYADLSEVRPEVDDAHRELILGCGAALFSLRVAMDHFGIAAHIDRFPDGRHPDLLARVTLTGAVDGSGAQDWLFDAIGGRRTTWRAFDERALPLPVTVDLEVAARRHGVDLVAAATARATRVVSALLADADRRDQRLTEAAPLVAFLVTEADRPPDWLAAGEALSDVLLEAHASGVAAAFVNQPFEAPELRRQLREGLRVFGFPQAGIRFGYALVR